MAVFPFTIRATDSEGSFADRQFSITVRNSRIERFMSVTNTDAYTSPDGQTWTVRPGMGGASCAYGNNMWLIGPTQDNALRKSNDGVNFTFIDPASMTFTHLNDPIINANVNPVFSINRTSKIRFFNGRFWFWDGRGSANSVVRVMRIWYSENGIDWFGRTLTTVDANTSVVVANIQNCGHVITEDNGALFFGCQGTGTSTMVHPSIGSGGSPLGFQSLDNGNTWTAIRKAGIPNTTSLGNQTQVLTRVNGVYLCTNYASGIGMTTGNRYYMYSTDGSNWTQGDLQTGNSLANAITTSNITNGFIYANGRIYLSMAPISSNGYTGFPYLVSSDGISWSSRSNRMVDISRTTSYFGIDKGFLAYKNGIFIQCLQSTGGNTDPTTSGGGIGLRFSTNGETWTNVNAYGTPTLFTDVAMM